MSNDEHMRWLASIFDEPAANLNEATRRDQIYGWDSLGMLTLMAELDEKFGIQLTDKDIEGLQSVGDVLTLVASRGTGH